MKNIIILFLLCYSFVFSFEELTATNFEEKTIGKKVILDFYAKTWDACKTLGESLTKYNALKKDDVVIYKIDIEKEKSLTKEFSVKVIPTLIYFKNDEIIEREIGIKTVEQIDSSVKEYLK